MPYREKQWSGWRVKGRKYANAPKDFQGHQYHSTAEAKVACDLDVRLRIGELTEVKRQVKIELHAHGKHICDYWIDFVITHKDGTVEYVEVKGFPTREFALKWKLFEAQYQAEHPHAILTIIKV